MIARRGFFGRLAGLLGLAALSVCSDATTRPVEPEPIEPEPIEIKKLTVTELPKGWVVTQYSRQVAPSRGRGLKH